MCNTLFLTAKKKKKWKSKISSHYKFHIHTIEYNSFLDEVYYKHENDILYNTIKKWKQAVADILYEKLEVLICLHLWPETKAWKDAPESYQCLWLPWERENRRKGTDIMFKLFFLKDHVQFTTWKCKYFVFLKIRHKRTLMKWFHWRTKTIALDIRTITYTS